MEMQIKIQLGDVLIKPKALAALFDAQQSPLPLLQRHRSGDWGDIDEGDKALHNQGIAHEGDLSKQQPVASAYKIQDGTKIWLITEADRSATYVFLLSEWYEMEFGNGFYCSTMK